MSEAGFVRLLRFMGNRELEDVIPAGKICIERIK